MNKIVVHACGGCGIKVADKVIYAVSNLGSGFAEFEFNLLDSSRVDYDNTVNPLGELFLVKSSKYTEAQLNGAGGDRRLVAEAVMESMPQYFDKHRFKKETNVYHLVVHSCSGGSGSTIGPMLADELLKKGIPTILFLVGDSSDDLKANNTYKVIKTYENLAEKHNTCLLNFYIDNATQADDILQREKTANYKMQQFLGRLSCFLSGENESVDSTDMAVFLNQKAFKSIDIKSGLYTLSTYSKKITPLPYEDVTGARALLITGDEELKVDVPLQHFKHGRIIDENAIAKMTELVPLYLTVSTGAIQEESFRLAEVVKKAIEREKSQKVRKVAEVEELKVQNEGGFIF